MSTSGPPRGRLRLPTREPSARSPPQRGCASAIASRMSRKAARVTRRRTGARDSARRWRSCSVRGPERPRHTVRLAARNFRNSRRAVRLVRAMVGDSSAARIMLTAKYAAGGYAMRAAISGLAVAFALTLHADAQQADFSQVQIKTTRIAGNFYTLEGQGGTIGVLSGPDGVLMVDAQFAPLGDKIVAAIKQISDGRIRLLVNTHVHGDHTGGNENIAKQGALIVAREN